MHKYIAVAGNIGVGKSSLTELLSRKLDWEPFFEAVDENPYLSDFYDDMRRWSFHSQIFFLSRRLRHHRQLMGWPGYVVQDRSVYEDAEIFARNLYLQGHMVPRDYDCYHDLYEAVTSILPPPDLVVYLRASTETLMTRIAQRGRAYEQDISSIYVDQLNRLYEEWIERFTLSPVLIVPGDRLDFVQSDADLDLIAEKVQAKLRGDQLVLF